MLQSVHTARAEFYMFLGRIFSNVPDSEFYQMLSDMRPKLQTLADSTDNEDIIKGAGAVISFIDKRSELSGKDLSEFDLDMARNYTGLFCLTTSVPTDESVYTNPQHYEKHDSFDQMRALFRKYGIEKSEKLAENDDFVSYEFIFMARLASVCAANVTDKACLEEQYNFHLNHFDKWIYDFFGRILDFKIADDEFYKAAALLGRGFLREDKSVLEELLKV